MLTARDRTILARLAELRFLSYAQIHDYLFDGASREAVGQRIRALVRDGWVTLWKEPVVKGGRPAFVLPTMHGLRIGLDASTAAVDDPRVRRLVRTMLPSGRRRPLVLAPGIRPPFLSHQRELNTLALDLRRTLGATLLWSSSWDRPFRTRAETIILPQPDIVCAIAGQESPRVIFLEHDRGQESIAHFIAAKVERYAELAVRPELLERLIGVRAFTVAVTVMDARFHRPLARLRHLADACVRHGADHLFHFALAGWVHAQPSGAIWLSPAALPDDLALHAPTSDTAEAHTLIA